MFKVAQWSLNLKKNTLSDMIEHFYLFPAICQPPPLTYGFSIFADISLYHIHLAANGEVIFVSFFNAIFFFFSFSRNPPLPSPPSVHPSSEIKMVFFGFKKIYLFFFFLLFFWYVVFSSLWNNIDIPRRASFTRQQAQSPPIRTCLHVLKVAFWNCGGMTVHQKSIEVLVNFVFTY